jgi:hypothetical protein
VRSVAVETDDRLDPSSLPITERCDPSIVVPGWQVARAGVVVSGLAGGPRFFGGFALDRRAESARQRARGEVFERVLALHEICSPIARQLPLLAWPSLRRCGEVSAAEVTLAPSGPNGRGAEGLGYGTSLRMAAEHAVHELLERDLAANVWYEGTPLRAFVGAQFGCALDLQLYTVTDSVKPFVLAVYDAPDAGAFVCGTAVREDLASASRKATEEVALLLETIHRGDDGPANSNETRARIAGLHGPLSDIRRSRIVELLRTGDRKTEAIALDPHVLDEVTIAVLWASEGHWVVRARHPRARSLPAARSRAPATCVSDPFC